jgi:hypothetical protein
MCFSSNFVRGAVFVVVVASAANLSLRNLVDALLYNLCDKLKASANVHVSAHTVLGNFDY